MGVWIGTNEVLKVLIVFSVGKQRLLLGRGLEEFLLLVPLGKREDDLIDAGSESRVMGEEPRDETLHFEADLDLRRIEVLPIQDGQFLLVLEGMLSSEEREDDAA